MCSANLGKLPMTTLLRCGWACCSCREVTAWSSMSDSCINTARSDVRMCLMQYALGMLEAVETVHKAGWVRITSLCTILSQHLLLASMLPGRQLSMVMTSQSCCRFTLTSNQGIFAPAMTRGIQLRCTSSTLAQHEGRLQQDRQTTHSLSLAQWTTQAPEHCYCTQGPGLLMILRAFATGVLLSAPTRVSIWSACRSVCIRIRWYFLWDHASRA